MSNPQVAPKPRVRLTEARNQQRLSQQALADEIGTNYVNVSRWERGITKPSPYFRSKLCAFFGKTELELDLQPAQITDKKPEEPSPPREEETSPTPVNTLAANIPIYDLAIPSLPAISLVGRNQEIAQIRAQLCANNNIALTALNGLPGVGKTALSITLAHDPEIRAHFQDGILWAGLGPTPNMPGLLGRWGTLLGISSTQMSNLRNNEEWARALRIAIGARRMLLVIDDAWQLEDALTFRVGGAHCAHLVTTRFPGIASHMTIDGATMIKELSEEASIKLLEQLAPQVVSREEQKVHTLVHAVGRLPLALTLIGNYLRKQSYSGQARRITSALERLNDAETRLQIAEPLLPAEGHPSLASETPLSLQSVIAVTDQLLTAPVRATLYALSVFPPKPNTFSEEAALAVTNCSIDELDALADAGLLECTSGDRYTLHQIIADYAHVHLNSTAPQERLISYVTQYVEVHKKDYELLEQESNIILAALEMAHAHDQKTALVKIVCAFTSFSLSRGQYTLVEKYLKIAYEYAKRLEDQNSEIITLLYLGETTQMQGNLSQSEIYLQQGLQIARRIQDSENICALLTNLGWIALKRGQFAQSEEYLQEGLELARKIKHQEHISGLLRVLGSVLGSQGDYAQAELYLQEGLNLARQFGDRERNCILLINLGTIAGLQGNHTKAEEYFQEGLKYARQIGHREQICILLINLGEAAKEKENYIQAEIFYQEGLDLARKIGQREWISILLINLSMTAQKKRNFEQAELYLQESLALARQIGSPRIICNALYEYGNLYIDQNLIEESENNFREMLNLVPTGDQEILALAHYGLARSLIAQGNKDESKIHGKESLALFDSIRHPKASEIKQWLEAQKYDLK